MAYRYGIDRNQLMMLPPVLDQYVPLTIRFVPTTPL